MEDAKNIFSTKKNIILFTSLLLAPILLFVFFFVVISSGKKTNTAATVASVARFCDGNEWKSIDSLNIPDVEKMQLKGALLKVSVESSALIGMPILASNAPFTEYISYVDKFYQIDQNLHLPVYFALKIADMAKNGADNAAITAYYTALTEKLKNYSLIK